MPRIRVGVRIRPPPNTHTQTSNIPGLDISPSPSSSTVSISASGLKHEFTFDTIYQSDSTQHQVFETAAVPIVKAATEGYNGCIFAFGQTGSGKTHTMTGPPGLDSMSMSEQRGFLARTIQLIFQQMKQSENLSLRVSVLEIYNEQLTDLLRETSTTEPVTTTSSFASNNSNSNKLTIVETAAGIQVPALFIVPVSSEDAAYTVFYEALSNRVMAEHNLNRRSSRSHVIYSFYITVTRHVEPSSPSKKRQSSTPSSSSNQDVVESKLHLVDLAGSERVEKTGSVGGIQKEANHINKSLSFLEHVVLALTKNKKERMHIPYRSSKLTYLLKDSLGGNCNTYLIACVWPHVDHTWETISTLRFAARIKFIENTPIRNSLMPKMEGPSHKALQQIEILKRELILRDLISMSSMSSYGSNSNDNNNNANDNTWLPDLTRSQKQRTARSAMKFVQKSGHGSNDNDHKSHNKEINMEHFELHSLSQFKLFSALMRDAIWIACGQDEEVVDTVMKDVWVKHSIKMNGGVDVNMNVASSNNNNTNNDNDNNLLSPIVEETEGRGFRFPDMNSPSLGMADCVVADHNDNMVDHTVDGEGVNDGSRAYNDHNDNHRNGDVMENFEEFKMSKGSILSQHYEEAKRTAKEAKLRYRHMIALINGQKSKIDELQDMLNENEENDGDNDGREGSLVALEEAKRSYREMYEEMQLCKVQVQEMQTLKQKTMASLVTSFQQYQTAFISNVQHV